MSYQYKEGLLKKGAPFKVSVKGHNNFFYPGDNVFHAHKDIEYERVTGWLSFSGLKPVRIESSDLLMSLGKADVGSLEKYSVVWITI